MKKYFTPKFSVEMFNVLDVLGLSVQSDNNGDDIIWEGIIDD